MATVVAGIDEAGYGPMLGPLCVGLTAMRIETGDGIDLWDLLSGAVCREPGRGGKPGPGGKIAVGDSKELKLSNTVKGTHPLVHLERGVLAFAACAGAGKNAGDGVHAGAVNISNDTDLYKHLCCTLGEFSDEHNNQYHHACYGGDAITLPMATHAGQLSIASALLRTHLERQNISIAAMRVTAVGERDFNSLIRECNNKGETTIYAVGKHLRYVWDELCPTSERCGVVCDRLGGRASYAHILERELKTAQVQILEENDRRSRYVVTNGSRRMGVAFITESEKAHLPVALASMTAKLVRELAMMRFNRYWIAMCRDLTGVEIAPTAGYTTDARRFLEQMSQEVMPKADREALVRIA